MSVVTKLQRIDQEEFINRITDIRRSLSDFLTNEGNIALLKGIQNKYAIPKNAQDGNDIGILLTLYITELISNQDLVSELALLVSPKYFKAFMQELEQKLFAPYDKFLLDAGLVYKQLTVLDPQPISAETKAPQGTPASTISVSPGQQPKPSAQSEQSKQQFIDTFFVPKPTGSAPIEITKTQPTPTPQQPVTQQPVPQPKQAPDAARIHFAPSNIPVPAPVPMPAAKPVSQEPELKQIRFTQQVPTTPAPVPQTPAPSAAPSAPTAQPLVPPQQKPSVPEQLPEQSTPISQIKPTPPPESQVPKPKTVIDLSTFGVTKPDA